MFTAIMLLLPLLLNCTTIAISAAAATAVDARKCRDSR
jgi:hypothetical protein